MAHLIIDTETTTKKHVYDFGGVVIDRKGNVIETFSFILRDTFMGRKREMATAYYADKLPEYVADIEIGAREVINTAQAIAFSRDLCRLYGITKVWAFNAKFDRDVLNTTAKDDTKGIVDSWFGAGIEFHDIMGAALSTVCGSSKYYKFAPKTKAGNAKVNAETVYRYLFNPDFVEAHTAENDALIEAQILAKCFTYHKSMDTVPKSPSSYPAWQKLQTYRD